MQKDDGSMYNEHEQTHKLICPACNSDVTSIDEDPGYRCKNADCNYFVNAINDSDIPSGDSTAVLPYITIRDPDNA